MPRGRRGREDRHTRPPAHRNVGPYRYLQQVRATKDEMCLALFVRVLRDVNRGGENNHQRCGTSLRIDTQNREDG